ncbi:MULTISPECIES: tripartite tricarboxylate transporter TctB family protein [unclassified Chelatococcus]|uniref:tripartite tricarboxylate transporter TctB family protein n=1 Tax=unclassified Chelatococcus TaxID=2638111 RepID=UPI001BD0DA05|nr:MULTISPECIES: tripartite tricarboxylate transporter TctB family protein [unclassified Chelatococcus]CAH1649978.1 Tripartite tricarboxylate transporter TctB family protein [Hyphomicrobiales bacterium]MBS7739674.1 tripartite tricarboxylate transporter TctB family protein [Chelatococcus sp. HY11]MBX3544043.1 tripartite tricarboxylate transporter TctB family protein [Chelatococcus sp.]MCO5075789.1 tripartite tricarboxylate transporter TctB family protein [Chelatococcus sp.]CAH1666759.1 Triparti
MAHHEERPAAGTARHLIRGPQNFAAGLSLIGIAILAFWASSDLTQGSLRAMGPGMLPRTIATLLALCGLILVAISFVKDGEALERWNLRGPFFVCLGLLAFAATVRTVGLAVAGPLLAIISGFASEETRIKELIVFAIAMTAFSIGLFKYGLNLPIPVFIIPGVIYY